MGAPCDAKQVPWQQQKTGGQSPVSRPGGGRRRPFQGGRFLGAGANPLPIGGPRPVRHTHPLSPGVMQASKSAVCGTPLAACRPQALRPRGRATQVIAVAMRGIETTMQHRCQGCMPGTSHQPGIPAGSACCRWAGLQPDPRTQMARLEAKWAGPVVAGGGCLCPPPSGSTCV